MSDVHPRHRYGTYALILALLAVVFAGFSKGSVWAQSEIQLNTTIEDDWGDPVTINATIESELKLREMDVAIEGSTEWVGGDDSVSVLAYSETESYEQLAQNPATNVSNTFESMDTAGMVAGWMIRLGIIATVVTAILCLCSLAQVLSSRPVLVAGGVSTGFLLLTPVIWFILLPSNGTYANDIVLGGSVIWFEEPPLVPIDFSPSPSTGLFLSVMSGLSSTTMMIMAVLHHRSEEVNHKPSWMIADDSTILPNATLSGLFSSDGDSLSLNFSALKSQPQKLVIPILQIVVIVVFSFVMSGTWASYTIDFDEIEPGMGSNDVSFTEDEVTFLLDGESIKFSYDSPLVEESWKEMGEAIGQSVSIGTIAIWMLILGLIWRFAVSIGGAQKIPALCQHHRIIDTLLMTGGSLLAFASLLYFMINSPSSAELFSDMPDEMIDGGTSFPILALMIVLVPNTFVVFTFGEFGAPVRNLLRSFDIPIPGEEGDADSASSSGESSGIATLLQNRFDDAKISGLPWVTIGVVILVLLALGGGGYLVYNMVGSSDDSEGLQTNILYNLSYSTSTGSSSDSVNVADGQEIFWTFNQGSAPNGSSLFRIFITFDYDETDADPFCDILDVELRSSPGLFDSPNSTSQGSANDCGAVNLELFIERGLECSNLHGSTFSLDSEQADWMSAYCNEHDGGVGNWEFSISIEDVGGPLENGEEVTITVEHMFGTLSLVESI